MGITAQSPKPKLGILRLVFREPLAGIIISALAVHGVPNRIDHGTDGCYPEYRSSPSLRCR
jgi:hypothetical protein